jgi:hypothetical protein
MNETTAEIWIGPDQSGDWMGTQGGINATHLMLLRENSRPAWILLPGNLYDTKPPVLKLQKAWTPTVNNPIQDALLQFAVLGAKVPEIRAVFSEFDKSRNKSRLDLNEKFPTGIPDQVYDACKRHLAGWHVVANVGNYSLANRDLESLKGYNGIKFEVRSTRTDF